MEGNILTEELAVQNKWRKYHEQLLLNFDDERVVKVTGVRVYGIDENWRIQIEVNLEDVRKAVEKLKKGKALGVDGITSEMLCFGDKCVF